MAEKLIQDIQENGLWLKQYRGQKTLSGRRWFEMQNRCTNVKTKQKDIGYKEATCHFEDFQDFVNWSVKQVGYSDPAYQLDKDFLVKNNKIYSSKTCAFIPQELNKFFNRYKNGRGQLPLGITKGVDDNYRARCWNGFGERVWLGQYKTVEEAFVAYKTFKEVTAKTLATLWANRVDQRIVDRLNSFCVDIED